MNPELLAAMQKLDEACNNKLTEFNAAIEKGNDEIISLGKMHSETKDVISKLTAQMNDFIQRDTRFNSVREKIKTSTGREFVNQKREELIAMSTKRQSTISLDFKNAITGMDDLIQPDVQPLLNIAMQTTWVRDLLPAGTTESDTIKYPRLDSFTNAAAPVAEGTQKPESAIAFTSEEASVVTIAHWVPIPLQKLADIPFIESVINVLLLYGLKLVEEAQILYGSGTGENLDGLITNAVAFDPTLITQMNVTLPQQADVLRAAIMQVVTGSKLRATGIVLNPIYSASLELLKNSNGNYLQVLKDGKIWNVPVIESPSITNDDFLVGAFAPGAMIFDREEATVRISTEDRDNFIKNMATILGENRETLVIWYKNAFVTGKFSTAIPAA